MEGSALEDLAERIATEAHAGQTDKSGAPYIGHPRRVAGRVRDDPVVRSVAWLHDVCEDSPTSAADLLDRGVPAVAVAAVDALTRRPGEAPDAYYARVRSNQLALEVKLADIADNSDPARLDLLPSETSARLRAKYAHATAALSQPEV